MEVNPIVTRSGEQRRDGYRGPNTDRFAAIIESASELFREQGFDGTSMQDIADRVGTRKGNLYHYVTSKDELLVRIVEGPAQVLLDEVARFRGVGDDADQSPRELWRRLMEVQVGIFAEYFPAPFIYLSLTAEQRRAHFPDWDSTYRGHLVEILRRGRDRGEYRADLDLDLAVRAILGVTAWMSAWYEPRGAERDELIIDQFSAFVFRALAA